MKTHVWTLGLVWVLVLGLLPGIANAQGGDEITLIPFESDTFGIQGLAPEGWDEAAPGVVARSNGPTDLTSLIQQAVPGMTIDQLVTILGPQLGIDGLPDSAGTRQTDTFAWTLYEIEVQASGLTVSVDVALAEDEAGTYLVLLQSAPEERDALYEAVFLPTVEALALIEVAEEPAEDLPYVAEEVAFENESAAVTLAGTLTLPPTNGPHPAVILITGSGPQDRDESLAPTAAIKPFRLIADHLTRQGIAVLRYDDRGTAASSGDHATATSADFATDAEAALDFLMDREDINPAQIGLLGHSEGGMIAPMIAARNPDVAFVISMAGTAVNGAEVLLLQNELIARASGASEDKIAAQLDFVNALIEGVTTAESDEDWAALEDLLVTRTLAQLADLPEEETAAISDPEAYARTLAAQQIPGFQTWFPFFFTYDPAEDWARVTVPALALFGGLDTQVDAGQNAPPLEAALQEAGNGDFTVITIPEANHLFQQAVSGGLDEYGTLEQVFHPDFLPAITDWLLARVDVVAE